MFSKKALGQFIREPFAIDWRATLKYYIYHYGTCALFREPFFIKCTKLSINNTSVYRNERCLRLVKYQINAPAPITQITPKTIVSTRYTPNPLSAATTYSPVDNARKTR